jgi:hypothetical protein
MKHGLARTLALIGLGLATFAVTPAHAQTTANGPYYATPSWDQTLPAATRFIVLSNFNSEAVLDRETGLVWTRSPNTVARTFDSASNHCVTRSTGNRAGWRLPTHNELASLFDPSFPPQNPSAPPLPSGHPFTGIPAIGFFWSVNQHVSSPNSRLTVGYDTFPPGILLVLGGSSNVALGAENFVWCVRGGLQPNAQ